MENPMVRIIPFRVLLKLWASGQSDALVLLLLRFTADVHTFCILRQAKSFRIYVKNFHPGGLSKWYAPQESLSVFNNSLSQF